MVGSVGEAEQVARILLSFVISLAIIYIIAKGIGEERKAQWFKKRKKSNIFTRRGFLGDTWNFGVPYKWQGFVVVFFMYGLIGVVSYFMIFTV